MKKRLIFTLGCLLLCTTALFAQRPKKVTVGEVTFLLPSDYEITGRSKLRDGEACLILPKGASNSDVRLVLKIHPRALEGINGITTEELRAMLRKKVDELAGVLADPKKSDNKLDRKYRVHFDPNADGSYYPHSYSYLNFTAGDGLYQRTYTEATAVGRKIVSGTAITTNEGDLKALIDIYMEVVSGADR